MTKNFLVFAGICLSFWSCNQSSTQSSDIKNTDSQTSYPQTVSCEMALDLESKSYSCNDFIVENLSEKKIISGACLFAGDGDLKVKVYSKACDAEKATSTCQVEDKINMEDVPTYYYINEPGHESLAKDSCNKLNGFYSK